MKNFYTKIKNHLIALFFIAFSIIFSWWGILSQSFMGEGYFYFGYGFFNNNIDLYKLTLAYDKGARIISDILAIIFRDNLLLYQIFLLLSTIVITFLFYQMVYIVSEKKSISLVSSFFFGVHFASLYQMLAIGYFAFYIERVINTFLIFPSLTFLILYEKRSKKKDIISSIFLYFLAVYLAHFSIFFLPLYISLIFVYALQKKNIKKKFYHTFFILPYVIFSLGMVFLDKFFFFSHLGRDTIPMTTNDLFDVPFQIIHQLTMLTVPAFLISYIQVLSTYSEKFTLHIIYLFIILLYGSVFIYMLFKKDSIKYIAIYSFFALICMAFLNLYMRWGHVVDLRVPSRYLFTLSVPWSIFWSIFLYKFILSKYKIIGKIIVIIIMLFWIGINYDHININLQKEKSLHIASKEILTYIKNESVNFKNDSFILVPKVIGNHGAIFIQKFYGKQHTIVLSEQAPLELHPKRAFNSNRDYFIYYDYKMEKVINDVSAYQKFMLMKKK